MKIAAIGLSLLVAVTLVHAEDAGKPFPERPSTDEVEPNAEQKTSVAKWIANLGDGEFQTRLNAEAELRKLGRISLKQLRAAEKDNADIQIRSTATKLIHEMLTEVWEGYYFYSLDDLENAVANDTRRVRFWFTVKRNEDGSFTADADEQDMNLGRSTIEGKVNRESGELKFTKKYVTNAGNWCYEGKWNAAKQRIDGTYGPGSGGFVIFPRKLSDDEHKRFDGKEPPPAEDFDLFDNAIPF